MGKVTRLIFLLVCIIGIVEKRPEQNHFHFDCDGRRVASSKLNSVLKVRDSGSTGRGWFLSGVLFGSKEDMCSVFLLPDRVFGMDNWGTSGINWGLFHKAFAIVGNEIMTT